MSGGTPGTIEYALRMNCAKQGCEAELGYIHSDDGDIYCENGVQPLPNNEWVADRMERATINGHACDVVARVMPAWQEIDPDSLPVLIKTLRTGEKHWTLPQ